MNKNVYVKDMGEIGSKSLSFINDFLQNKICDPELLSIISQFIKRRKKEIVRPWIIKNSWSFFCDKSEEEIKNCIPLASAAELENISNYQSNAVFDNKYVINSEKDKVFQIIASFFTRGFVDDILFSEYKNNLATLFSGILRKIDFYNQLGQYQEFSYLYYSERFDVLDINNYIDNYLKKAMYYGGAWVGGLIINGAILAKEKLPYNDKILMHLVKFGILSGTAMNIINDVSDYALFEDEKDLFGMHYKKTEDQFKDIENKKILLPFYYALHQSFRKNKGDNKILKNAIGKKLTSLEKNNILNLIAKYNGLSFAYTIAHFLNNRALRELNKIENKNKQEINYFKIFTSIVESNKFVHYYRSKKILKRITLSSRTKQVVKNMFFYNGGVANGMASDFYNNLKVF